MDLLKAKGANAQRNWASAGSKAKPPPIEEEPEPESEAELPNLSSRAGQGLPRAVKDLEKFLLQAGRSPPKRRRLAFGRLRASPPARPGAKCWPNITNPC